MTALYGHFQDWISLSQGRQHFVISILLVIGQNFMQKLWLVVCITNFGL